MVDIQLTDNLGKSAPNVKIDPSHPSSLVKYAKGALLHLAVAPDFMARSAQPLTTAAPNPISFQLELAEKFQLGKTNPTIDLTPSVQATIRVNTTAGSNLFENDPFKVVLAVPNQTGFVSLSLQGSLDLCATGPTTGLTFGFDDNQTVALEYWKAFPLGNGEPTLGEATGTTISGDVIANEVDDLNLLDVSDICTASGRGSLKISGGFNVSAVPNPLALANLPLNAGTLNVNAGVMAGIKAAYTITGAYQVRVRRTSADTIQLSFIREQGSILKTDLTVSAGVSVNQGDSTSDLLGSLLGAINGGPSAAANQKLFQAGGLSADEISTLNSAIKASLDHCLQVSLDLALSLLADDEAAFQYEIQPAQLDQTATSAVNQALNGDLSGLTALETGSDGAVLAPGVTLISSVLTTVRKRETSLKVNLLGLVNYISLTDLVQKCVVIQDPDSGELTIADSSTGDSINAVTEPQHRRMALHEAMFNSLMQTTTYRVSQTVKMTGGSSSFHFAFNNATSSAVLADYLNWLVVMNLFTKQQSDDYLKQFAGAGPSTCLLRAEFDDDGCYSLFFQSPGQLWDGNHYLDIGRQAMRALIDPNASDANRYRYQLLDQYWPNALAIGPDDNLGPLVGLQLTDSTQFNIIQLLRSDVYTIVWWASAMQTAGAAIVQMQQFLGGADPATVADSPEFASRRAALQKTMGGVIGKSQTQFGEPWGLISLFWASGSRNASAELSAKGLLIVKP